jgi:hypothetical protein
MVRRKGCFVFALVWSTWGAVLMAQAQVTRYVDPGNAKCSDKTGTPFCTIQSAILASNHGDTVLLADGEYIGPDNRNLVYVGRRITVASLNGPANCVINCQSLGRGFLFGAGENEESVLRGVTIRNGMDGYAGGDYRELCIN